MKKNSAHHLRSICIALVRLSWCLTCAGPRPLLEDSPLYENEDHNESSVPAVNPNEQVRPIERLLFSLVF
jgi:hypothetical protein